MPPRYSREITRPVVLGAQLKEQFRTSPCETSCPIGNSIQKMNSLIEKGQFTEALRYLRAKNPFPGITGRVCPHFCMDACNRKEMDGCLNIRALERAAETFAERGHVFFKRRPATGKKAAVIGGGPSGLSAAYYLALMGHKVTVYEKCAKLGGMLRYGIPNYRLPREVLDAEIASMLALGIDVHVNVNVGDDVTFDELRQQNDALYIALGAHTDKKTGIEGEDAKGVLSAVEMLRGIGDDEMPDFKGKDIIVIGGGNVAMDVARSSIRLGAKRVRIVYRRRQVDMTAMREEVEGAIQEGCEVLELQSPLRIEKDAQGKVAALWVKPQIIGAYDRGRPKPCNSEKAEERLACDRVLVAIGQGIESRNFEKHGIPVKRGVIDALNWSGIKDIPGVLRAETASRARDGHPRHCGGKGRGGEYRRISRLPPRTQSGRGDPAHSSGRPLSLRPREYDGAERVRAQKRFQIDGMRHERRGGVAGSAPLPSLRSFRLRYL